VLYAYATMVDAAGYSQSVSSDDPSPHRTVRFSRSRFGAAAALRPRNQNVEYRVVNERRPQSPIGLGTCLLITTVMAIVLLRFAWAPLLMGAVLLGVETPGEMVAALIGFIILAAVALRDRLNGRRL
jgi:hypothetical protein